MKSNQQAHLRGVAGCLLGFCIAMTTAIPLLLFGLSARADTNLERTCLWSLSGSAVLAGLALWSGKAFGLVVARLYFAGLAIVGFAGVFTAINGQGTTDLLLRSASACVLAALGLAYLFSARRVELTYCRMAAPPASQVPERIKFQLPPVSTEKETGELGDFKYYQQVNEELKRGVKDQLLWAQAASRVNGNFEQAHNTYITLRVAQLQQEASLQLANQSR